LLATGRYIGEGFDDQRLDTLMLAMPIAWKGTMTQAERDPPVSATDHMRASVGLAVPVAALSSRSTKVAASEGKSGAH
jgi:hypothetical protein